MRRELPTGTVTFLFTDVEGSTKLLQELGPEAYAASLAEHRRVLRDAFAAHDGVEVDTQGDAFFVAFSTAPGALAAARDGQEMLDRGPIRVRMGLHTGTPHLTEEGYVGVDVHRAARIVACGHGGQVLVSAATAALLGTVGLRDLGEHRLKDLSAAERVYQLGDSDFPPLKSLYQTNLPIPSTPFMGRERELQEVLALLDQEEIRLLTLTGPGGTGKTRLGLQAAAETAERYPQGVWWVPLATLLEAEAVLETAAHALGTRDGLAEHIGDKRLLLLFDNFEQVVEAATDLASLLASCPNLDLLVTSRELLRVPGEQAYPVPPLEPRDGTELFLARARAALPSFAASDAVPELCSRLENLPLALELAAARIRVLSPEQLLERLSQRLDLLKAGRGADPRQHTLRAAIEWSHDLLTPEERRLFARLAVFRGGCTLAAAEDVCDADLDSLQSLVDKSLVRIRDGDRFWMLETIREYAAERLEDSGEAEDLRRRHAEHFLALAEEAEPHLWGGSPEEWLDVLEREQDNLRAALDGLEASEGERALRLAGSLSEFWQGRGHVAEGRRRLESLLRANEHPTALRAKALNGAADLAFAVGDDATGKLRAEEALELHRMLGDAWGIANSTWELGYVAVNERDWEKALELLEEAVRGFRDLGDEHGMLGATRSLAWSYYESGDLERARALHEENLRRARALGNRPMQANVLGSLASLAAEQGRVEDAIAMLEENHGLYRALGDRLGIAANLSRFAKALACAGRAEAAVQLLSCYEDLREEIGGGQAWVTRENERTLAVARDELDEATFAEAWERGRSLTADEALALALESPGA